MPHRNADNIHWFDGWPPTHASQGFGATGRVPGESGPKGNAPKQTLLALGFSRSYANQIMVRVITKVTEMASGRRLSIALAALLTMGATPVPPVSLTIKDLTPKFLTFYRMATAQHLAPDARFALWKQVYGFAAVPPTPEGDQISRRLLDQAWPKYPSVLSRIEKGAPGVEPSPEAVLRKVGLLLGADRPIKVTLLVYVGALEGNAFTAAGPSGVTVAVPVEETPFERGPVMTHEFVHATQISMGSSSGGWIRTIAETVLSEGLAMRAAQHLYPERPAASFVEMSSEPGWLAKADAIRPRILRDVRTALSSESSEDVMRFTMGVGPAGIDREAYYVGWTVVGYWLAHGMTYAEIARIKEADAPARVGAAIDEMLKAR